MQEQQSKLKRFTNDDVPAAMGKLSAVHLHAFQAWASTEGRAKSTFPANDMTPVLIAMREALFASAQVESYQSMPVCACITTLRVLSGLPYQAALARPAPDAQRSTEATTIISEGSYLTTVGKGQQPESGVQRWPARSLHCHMMTGCAAGASSGKSVSAATPATWVPCSVGSRARVHTPRAPRRRILHPFHRQNSSQLAWPPVEAKWPVSIGAG